jgi:death-on-curing protein
MTEIEPLGLPYEQVVAMHHAHLRRFGGTPGLRDDDMLRSVLEWPAQKHQKQPAGLAELAAAYAFGLAKNHAFVDGNKRIAFMSMMAFLRKNDVPFAPDPAQATTIILGLAAGEISEDSLARWISDNWPKA